MTNRNYSFYSVTSIAHNVILVGEFLIFGKQNGFNWKRFSKFILTVNFWIEPLNQRKNISVFKMLRKTFFF